LRVGRSGEPDGKQSADYCCQKHAAKAFYWMHL
jgi:hypothetical protein